MSTETPILSIKNIEVLYSRVISALHGVSIEVQKGEIVSLLGANGAGKTTTCKAVSRLLEAERGEISKGSIEYNGVDIQTMSPYDMVKAGVVQVLEGRHIFGHLTVEENLLTGSFIRNADNASVKQDLEYVYERFKRIKDRRKNLGGLCSGGEQQMVAMGRAMMARPNLILLDEPSMGLAPQLIEEIFEIVKTLNEEDGTSFLVSEQNANIALKYAETGYIIENGRVVLKGSAKELSGSDSVQEMYMGGGGDDVSFKDVKYYHRRKPCMV
jgi:branched-chain amino acid transport system ATP-binding protein